MVAMESLMKVGAHSASDPVTNATLVNPTVDSIKLLLKHSSQSCIMTNGACVTKRKVGGGG